MSVEDRWVKNGQRTDRWGKGLRYRRRWYAGKRERSRSFATITAARNFTPPRERPPARPRRLIEVWTAEQAAAVRGALPPEWAGMADLGKDAGLRQGEIFAFGPDELDVRRREIRVTRQIKIVDGRMVFAPPKGGRERIVRVDAALIPALEELPAVPVTLPWKHPGGRARTHLVVFTRAGGRPIDRNWFNRWCWKPALCQAGLEPSRANGMHALRHLFATALLAANPDDKLFIRDQLGHAHLETTEVYLDRLPGHGRRAAAAMSRARKHTTPRRPGPAGDHAPAPLADVVDFAAWRHSHRSAAS